MNSCMSFNKTTVVDQINSMTQGRLDQEPRTKVKYVNTTITQPVKLGAGKFEGPR